MVDMNNSLQIYFKILVASDVKLLACVCFRMFTVVEDWNPGGKCCLDQAIWNYLGRMICGAEWMWSSLHCRE